MPQAPRTSPLDDTDRVLVDGTNLLHRVGGAGTPPAAIIGKIRGAIPLPIAIELVFDGAGHGVPGRVAQQMHVRYSGRRTADETIIEIASDGAASPLTAAKTLVITDDRMLRTQLMARGARTAGLDWLLGRMNVAATAPAKQGPRRPTLGSGRPPAAARGSSAATGAGGPGAKDDDGRPRWSPGRGATAKTGTPKKVARHRRHPNHP
jgi:hypothetical protein